LCVFLFPEELISQGPIKKKDLDEKVTTFLKKRQGSWIDLNVPASDGKILYNLIIKNKYKKALEIGTSTGHSSIYIAWALSKTGGRLITIEIEKERYQQALANFNEVGLSEYIDARLADAHTLVKQLQDLSISFSAMRIKRGINNILLILIRNLNQAVVLRLTMFLPGAGVWEKE
jgi:caffeoyl-CoA O-methyltransferase